MIERLLWYDCDVTGIWLCYKFKMTCEMTGIWLLGECLYDSYDRDDWKLLVLSDVKKTENG